MPVHDGNQVQESLPKPDVRDVAAPDLIRTGQKNSSEHVWKKPDVPDGCGQPRLRINGFQSHGAHQSANPFGMDRMAFFPEQVCHPENPVKGVGEY